MIKKVESLTGSLSMPRGGSGTNDYEKLINKPLVFDSSANFPPTGNAERLYIATNVNKIYYWTGTAYADISGSGGGGGGTDGKSPYIGENGNWFEYNDVLQAWADTGVRAEGKDGKDGVNGLDGINGADGKSAYEVWLNEGNIGSELDFLNSLKGENGIDGIDGIDGNNGTSITSALVNNDGDLIVTLDTGVSSNAGHVKGADGTSINIKGDLLSPDDLPSSDQELGDCYIILGHLWVYVDSTDVGAVNGFKDVGNIQGVDGKSAYEVAVKNGFTGTETEWLLSLKGDKGDKGEQGEQGADGINGLNGTDGKDGIDGLDGKSAYEIAVENGFVGTEAEWLASLKGADGAKGDKGDKGDTGANGTDGTNGIDGTDGSDGADGKSAYQIWLDNGNTGTELEFLASLKGEQGLQGLKGDKGDKGEDGYTPIKGTDYFTPADIASLGIKPTITTNLSATTQTVTLTDNTEYRYGTLTSLTITWTTSDIRCSVAFTGGTGVTFSITAGVKIVGTDVTDGVFAPVKGKRYNLGFEYDGINRTMYVSGVE